MQIRTWNSFAIVLFLLIGGELFCSAAYGEPLYSAEQGGLTAKKLRPVLAPKPQTVQKQAARRRAEIAKRKILIRQLIQQLDAPRYAVRETAQRRLSGMNTAEVLTPLTVAVSLGVPESGMRIVAILERLYAKPENSETMNEQLEAVLEKISHSKDAKVAAHSARSAISRTAPLRRKRALLAVKRLGGVIRYRPVPLTTAVKMPAPMIQYIILGDLWKGGDDGVKYLKRIPDLTQLYVAQNQKFRPASPKTIAALKAALPQLDIQFRGLSCLGVQGSLHARNACYVSSVESGSAAERGGLKEGDQITQVDSKQVESFESLVKLLSVYSPNEKIKVKILRHGRTQVREIVLQGWRK